MTMLRQLQDDAAGSGVPLSELLRRLKVLAARLRLPVLAEWVEHEISGYPDSAALPSYRGPFTAQVTGTLVAGASIARNVPISTVLFPPDMRDSWLFKTIFLQSVAELERMAAADGMLTDRWPADAIALVQYMTGTGAMNLNGNLVEAASLISPAQVAGVLEQVRNRVLDLALGFEDVSPDIGEADGNSPDRAALTDVVNVTVFGSGNNFAIASHGQISQQAGVPAGDRAALRTALSDAGLDEDELAELDAALDEDGPGVQPGPRTRNWLGKVAMKSGETAGKVGTSAAGGLATAALRSYFGI